MQNEQIKTPLQGENVPNRAYVPNLTLSVMFGPNHSSELSSPAKEIRDFKCFMNLGGTCCRGKIYIKKKSLH